MTLAVGTLIGKYVVKRKLAEGGMAEIFLCTAMGPEGFEKEVVIKRIRPFLASDPKFVEMFIREAQLASKLNHANIVQIFDFDKHEDTYYLAMEYVHGRSLWELRRKCHELMEPLGPVLVAHIGVEVARGLHHAHRLSSKGKPLGIVHRDVTPHNVLLSFDGAVKLTDFGIAHVDTTATAPGMLKGKFAYMSPEQGRGEAVDARTDVFALGIVLWEMLTGARLFEASNEIAVLRAVQSSHIAPPSRVNEDVPEALSARVMKALERDPAARYASAQEFERELKQFVIEHAEHFEDTDVGGALRKLFPEEATMVRGMSLSASALTPPQPAPEAPREPTAVQRGALPPRPATASAATAVLRRENPLTERMPSVPKPVAPSLAEADAAVPDSHVRPTVSGRSLAAVPLPLGAPNADDEQSAAEPTLVVRSPPATAVPPPPPPEASSPGILASPDAADPSSRRAGKSAREPVSWDADGADVGSSSRGAPGGGVRSAAIDLETALPHFDAPQTPPAAQPLRASGPARGLLVAGAVFIVGVGIAAAVGVRSARDGASREASAAAGHDFAASDETVRPGARNGSELGATSRPGSGEGDDRSKVGAARELPDASATLSGLTLAHPNEDAGAGANAAFAGGEAATVSLALASFLDGGLAAGQLVAEDGGTATNAVVPKKKGTLRLSVAPWAKVVIDGAGRGEVASPRQFLLDVGEHRLRLEHPRGNREQRFTIQAGRTTSVSANMLTPP